MYTYYENAIIGKYSLQNARESINYKKEYLMQFKNENKINDLCPKKKLRQRITIVSVNEKGMMIWYSKNDGVC